ncbi:hypothetical protein [Spirosoma sp.]|uniref:hypothetical protein n=1 Tax=Spirosoma sp. TaxID=1899569 RepID=UPI003B3A93CC
MENSFTSSTFIKKLFNSVGQPIEIKGYKIGDSLSVKDNIDFKCDGIRFIDCEFAEDVNFIHVDLKEGLFFYNCVFHKNFNVIDCTSSYIGHEKPTMEEYNTIHLGTTSIKSLLNIQNSYLERGLGIKSESDINSINVYGVTCGGGSQFSIVDSKISETINIDETVIKGDLSFQKSILQGQIRIESLNCSRIAFIKVESEKDIFVRYSNLQHGITFNYGSFKDDVKFECVKSSSGYLTLIGTEFKRSCEFFYNSPTSNNVPLELQGGCKEIHIDTCVFDEILLINGLGNVVNPYELESVNINCSALLKGQILIRDFKINIASMQGVNSGANLIFDLIQFHKLNFLNFSNFSKLQLLNCTSDKSNNSEFSLLNSSLGAAQFFNLHLNSFKKIIINDSIVSEIIVSNVHWFTPDQLEIASSIERKDIGPKRRKELFRQLKYGLEKQGDRIQSLLFQQYEMEAFKEELTHTQKPYNGDRLIMFINQSNDYGSNWKKPVLWLFAFTIIFYFLIVTASYRNMLAPSSYIEDWQDTLIAYWVHKPSFFQMLNPTYLFDRAFKDGRYNLLTALFDILHRIVLAYFIFQIVSAFRKFVK